MRPSTSRRSGLPRTTSARSHSTRLHGRVTREDIRSAGLRRWNGRARITTDWVNLYQEPELAFLDGDILVYLREPGQSSRGPALQVHKSQLHQRGFGYLLEKCVDQLPIHPGAKCLASSCRGCDKHLPLSELYIPAPPNSSLAEVFDYHITTRNFFAWLYDLPLAGRALGISLVNLRERIDCYRPGSREQSAAEIVAFAESQRYLDFRECVDHALAALSLAEYLHIEDLWIDAFAHCVGMSHRGINTSLEYAALSYDTRVLISEAQLELESRTERVRRSVGDFFEGDLSGNFLGLSQSARDHLDHFRSWLHSYHIEQHGFWPPANFEQEAVQRNVYSLMYTDFKDLYHHLADPGSSASNITDLDTYGGVCTVQNIQAYDTRHKHDSLPSLLPLLPREPDLESKALGIQRRKSWNPITRRKVDKSKKRTLQIQALITASNRDWTIMDCPLVRRYSEFESQTIINESETITMVEGRKVRWILIYAILQTLISVMQTPHQVRNSDSLTYSLSCSLPKHMPWRDQSPARPAPISAPASARGKEHSALEPDMNYLQANLASTESLSKTARSPSKKTKEARRQSLPARVSSMVSRPSTAQSSALKRLMIRRNSLLEDVPPVPKSPSYCEIVVHGYGNGLNEVVMATSETDTVDSEITLKQEPAVKPESLTIVTQADEPEQATQPKSPVDKGPDFTPPSSTTVSRESSNASSNSSWSKGSSGDRSDSDLTIRTPVQAEPTLSLQHLSKMTLNSEHHNETTNRPSSEGLNHVLDESGYEQTAHMGTSIWDAMLQVAK